MPSLLWIVSEMGKTYKVHKFFDVDEMTMEEPCTCSSPVNFGEESSESGTTIFNSLHFSTESELNILHSYNTTRNGTIFSEEDVDWAQLKKSECEA